MAYAPFVYLLKFLPTGELYYGSRTAKNCQTSDLWTTYFTSSRIVEKLIEEHGKDSFEFEVRKTFKTKLEAIRYEHRLLKRVNARKNPKFLNKSNGNNKFITIEHTKESRKKISDRLIGIKRAPFSAEHRKKLADAKIGKPRDQSTKDKISKNQNRSEETSRKKSVAQLGHEVSTETRNKISDANTGTPMPVHVKEALLEANVGRKQSTETIEKRRISCTGLKRSSYSDEHRAKISAAMKESKET